MSPLRPLRAAGICFGGARSGSVEERTCSESQETSSAVQRPPPIKPDRLRGRRSLLRVEKTSFRGLRICFPFRVAGSAVQRNWSGFERSCTGGPTDLSGFTGLASRFQEPAPWTEELISRYRKPGSRSTMPRSRSTRPTPRFRKPTPGSVFRLRGTKNRQRGSKIDSAVEKADSAV